MDPKRSTTGSLVDKLVSVCIVLATGLAIVLFVKREGYFPAMSKKAEPLRSHLAVARTAHWPRLLAAGNRDGIESAPVQVVEFADFECPVCQRFERELKQVKERYGDSMSVTFVHYPLSYHRFAIPTARAAECAADQGRLREMHDVLFEQQDSLGLKSYVDFASDAGVGDMARFGACSSQRDTARRIRDGLALGDELHIMGTPTIVVNGWFLSSVPTSSEIVAIAERSRRGELRQGRVNLDSLQTNRGPIPQ